MAEPNPGEITCRFWLCSWRGMRSLSVGVARGLSDIISQSGLRSGAMPGAQLHYDSLLGLSHACFDRKLTARFLLYQNAVMDQ